MLARLERFSATGAPLCAARCLACAPGGRRGLGLLALAVLSRRTVARGPPRRRHAAEAAVTLRYG